MSAVLSSLGPLQINGSTYPVLNINMPFAVISEASEHSGQLYSTATLISGANPTMTAQMPFRAAFDLIGFGALAVTSVGVFLSKYAATGLKSTDTDHRRFALASSAKGLATITGVSVAQDGLLLADIEITFSSADGTTHPLSPGTAALPALSAQPVLHTVGPAALANTVRDGVSAWSVSLNQRVSGIRSDGDLYPQTLAYTGGVPEIAATFQDADTLMSVLGAIGIGASTTTVLYAKQYDATTGLVVGGATAVSITLAGGYIAPETLAAAHAGVATYEVRILPAGTTPDVHALTVATNATAPA